LQERRGQLVGGNGASGPAEDGVAGLHDVEQHSGSLAVSARITVMTVILDLDGVIWLAGNPIPGSNEAVARLREAGQRILFVTNNSNPTVAELVEKLESFGISAERDELVTSSQAAASLLERGSSALVCGGPGVTEALEERGVKPVHEGKADAVVVGFHREFDYDRLTAAFRAVFDGAKLIGTNDDPTYPTPEGPVPGGGSLLAAVATAAEVEPVIAGKPNEGMVDLVRERLGDDLDGAVLVGDRPSTDGLMARRLGLPFALVLSGVTPEQEPGEDEDTAPEMVADDLASLVGPDGGFQESA
jgi:4-nitrophenyl phosphatase